MRPCLLLILSCCAILTGCNSEEKAQVRRNKAQIDAELADVLQRVTDLISQEEDLDFEELSSQAHSLCTELDQLEMHYSKANYKAQDLGIDDELYLEDYKGINEMGTALAELDSAMMSLCELVALRVSYPDAFIYFLKDQPAVDWDEFIYRRSKLIDDLKDRFRGSEYDREYWQRFRTNLEASFRQNIIGWNQRYDLDGESGTRQSRVEEFDRFLAEERGPSDPAE